MSLHGTIALAAGAAYLTFGWALFCVFLRQNPDLRRQGWDRLDLLFVAAAFLLAWPVLMAYGGRKRG